MELLERGELKFTYEEADNFGDSCGSAESEEGSDTEVETEVEHTFNGESHYFDISTIKAEDDEISIEVRIAVGNLNRIFSVLILCSIYQSRGLKCN